MRGSRPIWMSHVAYEWAMSRRNESCNVWMSHVTCAWVMSHMHELCHVRMSYATYESVTSYIDESCRTSLSPPHHYTHTNTYTHITTHTHLRKDLAAIQRSGKTKHLCDMTPSYATWPIHMWHDSFIQKKNACIRDVTHEYATWLIHM